MYRRRRITYSTWALRRLRNLQTARHMCAQIVLGIDSLAKSSSTD